MLIKETYSKKKYKKKRRKPFFEALLKVKSDESNLSLFGALNAENIKKVKANIRNNVKDKENKKPKAAKESYKEQHIVFNETLDDTFDRLFTNSKCLKPKQSTPGDQQGTIKNYCNAKQMSQPDLRSPVSLKNTAKNMQRYTGKGQANIFHLTSTPISSPSSHLGSEGRKINYEHRHVDQPSLSQLSTSFLNLSVKLYPDKENESLDQLKSQPEIISAASPDMFSNDEDSVRKSNQCFTRNEYSNGQLTNVSFNFEPSVQIISDSSLNANSYKSYPMQGSSHVSSQENIFENCILNVSKEEKLDISSINVYKQIMTKTAPIGLHDHTEFLSSFDQTCDQKSNPSDSSIEVNDLSQNTISKSNIPSMSRINKCSLNTVLSINTSNDSDVSMSPGCNHKNSNFVTKNNKSKRRFSIKATKQINIKRKFNSAGSMKDKSLTNLTRKIKSVGNIQATIKLHEHKENVDGFDKICDKMQTTDSSLEVNDVSKINSLTSRRKMCSSNTDLSSNTLSDRDHLIFSVSHLKNNNVKAKNKKNKKRSTLKANNPVSWERRIYSTGSMADQVVMKPTRNIKSVDIFQGRPRKKCNSSNKSYIVCSSETSKSEVDSKNNACDNCEDIFTVSDQSGSDSDVFLCSNDNSNAKKKLGAPQEENEGAKVISPISITTITRNMTSKLSSHLLDETLPSAELSFELKYKKSGKNNKYFRPNKNKVSCKRGVHSEENKSEKILDKVSKRQIKSFSDVSEVLTAENHSAWKKSKRISIARKQSHLVKNISIFKDDDTSDLFRTSYTPFSCSSRSTSIHKHLELSPRNVLDVLAEEDTGNDDSSRNSIKSSNNLIETSNYALDTASIPCSVLLCNTVDCDIRETSGNFMYDIESHAKDFVLQKCGQSHPLPFTEIFTNSYLKNCKKIGEGVYGEVFLCDHVDGSSTILKIIPIEGNIIVNGEKQKKFHEILTEVLIAFELSDLRYNSVNNTDVFSEFVKCWCVVGSYPDKLIQLWNEYSVVNGTENDSPTILDQNQLFLVLEMKNGGKPLESYVFNSAEQSSSLLLQVAFGLAVAESAMEFEHRDLHWGNVLVAPTKSITVIYVLNGSEFIIPTKGVKATIIDFTLSRMLHKGCSIYNDLSLDPSLFTATGEYQFEIYRLMKDAIRSEWINFEPYTNVLWLHYLLDKCLKSVYYHRKNTKVHKKYINILKVWFNVVKESNSATNFVTHLNYS